MPHILGSRIMIIALCMLILGTPVHSMMGQTQQLPAPQKLTVDPDGTVHLPELSVPVSGFLIPEGSAYMAQHLQAPATTSQEQGIPIYMKPFLERNRVLFPVERADRKIGGQ